MRYRDLLKRLDDASAPGEGESADAVGQLSRAVLRDESVPRAADHDSRAGLAALNYCRIALMLTTHRMSHRADIGMAQRDRIEREFPLHPWTDATIASAVALGRELREAMGQTKPTGANQW